MARNCPQLTFGAIAKMLNREDVVKPVLQIISLNPMSEHRYWIKLWDGINEFSNFIIDSSDLSSRISIREFESFSVVLLKDYRIRRLVEVIHISDLSVIVAGHRIGKKLMPNVTEEVIPISEPLSDINANVQLMDIDVQQNVGTCKRTTITMAVDSNPSFCSIKSVNPSKKNWTIRGRVTSKAPRKVWSNAHCKAGSVFSFEFSDQSGDILIKAFNDECERFYPIIQMNSVYVISNATVRKADKRFSNLENNYEIVLNMNSTVEECHSDDAKHLPKIRYRFKKLKLINHDLLGTVVDVIGIVREIVNKDDFVDKLGRNATKMDLILVDDSRTEVRMTFWNELAQSFECEPNAVIAIKSIMVKDYDGLSLSSVPNTMVAVEPYLPESVALREWRKSGYLKFIAASNLFITRPNKLPNRKLLCQISEIDAHFKNSFFVRTKVAKIMPNILYKGCDQRYCLKEVLEMSNGGYYCEKCRTDCQEFRWRMTINALLADCTGQRWVTVFHNEAERLIQITADGLNHLEENNRQHYDQVIASTEFKTFVFKIGTKIEFIDSQKKIKLIVHDFKELDAIKFAKRVLPDIKRLNDTTFI